MKEKKIVTICSSISFYREVIEIEKALKALGFTIKLPLSIHKIKKQKGKSVEMNRPWLRDKNAYKLKTKLMKIHFKKIIESDAILVVNEEKHGMKGYIGGNVLMEMVLAFHYQKPIYILHDVSDDLGYKEEIYGLQPVFLHDDIKNILRS